MIEQAAEPQWLTIEQVASMLQVSTRTVQRLIAPSAGRDRLLAARIGTTTRIRRAALDRWLAAREKA